MAAAAHNPSAINSKRMPINIPLTVWSNNLMAVTNPL